MSASKRKAAKKKRRGKLDEQSSADRKQGVVQFRVSPDLHPLLQRGAAALTFGRLSAFVEKSILEEAQRILPNVELAKKLPKSPKTPKGQGVLAEQCLAVASRIAALAAGRSTFGYRADPLMYTCLLAVLGAHVQGSAPPPVPSADWLYFPPAGASPKTALRISCGVELATQARLDLVQETRGFKTTRLAAEHCIWTKLNAHGLSGNKDGHMVFTSFPPLPLMSFTRYLDDTMMPLTRLLADLPRGAAGRPLAEAMASLREVLQKHPAPPRSPK